MKIITKRPDHMSYAAYREHMREQSIWLKSRLKGHIVYKAVEMCDFDVVSQSFKTIRRFPPFVGSTRNLKPI